MGAIAKQLPGRLSADDYLAFLATRPGEERWQLLDGIAVMMTPPTLVHQRIAMNLASRLNQALDVHRPDLVALVEAGLTVPGRPDFLPSADVIVLKNPVDYSAYAGSVYLTAEIRSRSNTREYMSLKQERYTEHPDNLHSLILSQRQIRVELRSRRAEWALVVLDAPDDLPELPEFGFRCQVRDLYRGTPLA
jgi:Uma2 family endonuclease